MRIVVYIFVWFSFLSLSFGAEKLELPHITDHQVKEDQKKQNELIEELLSYDLKKLDESENINNQESGDRGSVANSLLRYLVSLVNKRVFPDHLRDFDHKTLRDNSDKEVFLKYKGVSGKCYHFRIFHKNKDELEPDTEWASSILTIPAKGLNPKANGAGLVLAPSLQGPTMFIEGGIWNQLCSHGVASITPESLYYKNWLGRWKKIVFDPSPKVDDPLDFSLYEKSISRYKKLLLKNISFLKNFNSLKVESGESLLDLPVVPVKKDKIAYWGSSLGAIVGSIIIAQDPQIKASVLTVSGGDLPFVISRSTIGLFRETRAQQMRLLGIKTISEYEDFLAKHLTTDPLDFVSEDEKDRVYMIIGEKDTSVPTSAQLDMYNKMNQPRSSFVPGGHVFTLIYTAWVGRSISDEAIDFLLDRL